MDARSELQIIEEIATGYRDLFTVIGLDERGNTVTQIPEPQDPRIVSLVMVAMTMAIQIKFNEGEDRKAKDMLAALSIYGSHAANSMTSADLGITDDEAKAMMGRLGVDQQTVDEWFAPGTAQAPVDAPQISEDEIDRLWARHEQDPPVGGMP